MYVYHIFNSSLYPHLKQPHGTTFCLFQDDLCQQAEAYLNDDLRLLLLESVLKTSASVEAFLESWRRLAP